MVFDNFLIWLKYSEVGIAINFCIVDRPDTETIKSILFWHKPRINIDR